MEKFRTTIVPAILAILLYLLTLALGMWDIYLINKIFLNIFPTINTPAQGSAATFLSYVIVIVLGLVFVGFAFTTAEYHRKHFNQPGSWKLFVQSLAIEAIFPLLAFFMDLGAA